MARPLRVLIVHDSAAETETLLRALRAGGFDPAHSRLDTAPALAAALDRATWELILAARPLPSFTASHALRMVRERGLDTPFIIISAIPDDELAVEAMREGANDYLMKGALGRLGAAVDRELRESSARAAHRHALEQLRQNEARYRLLFENSPLPKWLFDNETLRILEVNNAAVHHYGYSRAELLRMTVRDIRPPEDVPRLLERLQNRGAGISDDGIWRHRKKDGTVIDVQVTSTEFPLAGRPARLVVAEDVTHRRKSEEALKASEERFRAIFEQAAVGMAELDPVTGSFLRVNQKLCEISGYTRDELLAKNWLELVHPEETESVRERIQQVMGGDDRPISRERRFVRKDGALVWGRVTGSRSAHPQGGATLVAIVEDVTASREAKDALLASEQRLRSADAARRETEQRFGELAAAVREVFWMNSPDEGKVLYVSPAYDRVWGRSGQRLLESPRDWMDAIHPEDRRRVSDAVQKRQAAGTYDEEYRIIRPDGTVRWIRDRASPVHDASGRVARIAGVAEDITERRGLEDQLRQAQKMEAIGSLAGGVAHDFNNLLTVILSYAEMLGDQAAPESPLRSDLEEIRRAGERAADLTRQLLAFSRQQILQPRIVDLNEILSGMEKMLHRLIGEDIELVAIAFALPRIRERRPRPGRAGDHEPGGQRPRRDAGGRQADHRDRARCCSTRRTLAGHADIKAGPHVMLAVSDTGIGMDAATPGAHLRAVLHHQGTGQGNGPRALHGLRDRPAERRHHLGLQRAGTGDDVQDLPARRPRRRAAAATPRPATTCAEARPSCSSRTTRACARWCAPSCSAPATTCSSPRTAARRC